VTPSLYRCSSCLARWQSTHPTGPSTQCAKCGSLYVYWLNYEAWVKAPGKSAAYQREYGRDGAR
jgi:DNA-directed RNA polymerase subunit RPC12/RpoP